MLCFAHTLFTELVSPSRRIPITCSSLNRLFFMGSTRYPQKLYFSRVHFQGVRAPPLSPGTRPLPLPVTQPKTDLLAINQESGGLFDADNRSKGGILDLGFDEDPEGRVVRRLAREAAVAVSQVD